jgi:hypothetical protein
MNMRGLAAVVLLFSLAARADEGMWTFDNLPLQQMKEKYRFVPDEKWIEHVRLSAVEFGSASGAFVSRDGLVLTNHHVGLRSIEKVSEPGEKDYARNGFVARTREEEIRIPDLKLYTLVKMVNVTDKVNAAVKPGMDDREAMDARKAELARLRDKLDRRDGLFAWHVPLYSGGEYWVYLYKVHRDVRLVMAPEKQIAFFGGDPDNFTYPRHDLDFALFRVYEGGAPYHPAHYLKWSTGGARPGEPAFVIGCPGSTQRMETIAQMRHWRDVELPMRIRQDEARRAAIAEYGNRSEDKARRSASDLFFTENSLKAARGELEGLLDVHAFAQLEEKEAQLRALVAKDETLQAGTGQSWARIEEAVGALAQITRAQTFVNSRNSTLLRTALGVVRCAQELDRPPRERLAGYRSRDDEEDQKWRMTRAISIEDLELETFLIAKGLEDIRQQLDPQHPLRKAVLGDREPMDVARDAVADTRIQAIFVRRDTILGRASGVAKSKDGMVQLARRFESYDRDLQEQRERLEGIIRDHEERIARARFAVFGKTLYPDATGTLRFAYGAVAGYEEQGRRIAPFTTLSDLYARARDKGPEAGGGAWALPGIWEKRKALLNLETPLNFVTSADIVGGNSGSPTINASGELIGVVFDGNLQSLPGKFYFDEKVNRAISVDGRAIIEAMVNVYDAKPLANELLSR